MPDEPFDRGGLPPLRVRDADPGEIEAVLRAGQNVRGGGGTPDGGPAGNESPEESFRGDERSRFIIGIAAGGEPVASLKLHSFEGLLNGRQVRVAGIGALFTLPEQRGRRFGAALVESVLDRARHDRFGLALLLSDIAAGYFKRLGFFVLPGGEASCVTTLPAPWPGEPAWVAEAEPPLGVPGLRTGGPDDVETLLRLHEGYDSSAPLRLTRDRTSWAQLLRQAESGRRPGRDDEMVIWMIDDDAGPAAYAVMRFRVDALRWLEHGARTGGERRLGDLFWAAISSARRRGLTRLDGWSLPRGAAGETLYPIARRARRRPLLMARALDPGISLSGLRTETDCRIGELDRF